MRKLILIFSALLASLLVAGEDDYNPEISAASSDAEQAIKNFQLPASLKAELFAAEPQLANPVGFSIDMKGRVYVLETFRAGISDIDGPTGATVETDFAHRTIDQRIEWLKKKFGAEASKFEKDHERVRMLEDTNGDGKADRDSVFMISNGIADGIGAGILANKGDVYWACSPRLWKLGDSDGDGKADVRETLHYGFGVHGGVRGHDLHGLRIGPDGKLYMSMGDRGFHIIDEKTKRVISSPDTGGVLRCNLDGSDLEIFALGLRNSEDLAFDEYGNMFTCDNDSGVGDKCKIIYIVEGADNGWRNGYQFIHLPTPRGMWNLEKLWQKPFKGQAAYITPAVFHLTNGPAGITYYPGTGFPEHFNKRFFLADFRYSASGSGLHTFHLNPSGASFEFADEEKSIWNVLLTDADFGPDSQLYCTDWISGGAMPKKGRIYRIFDPELQKTDLVQSTKKILNAGMEQRTPEELIRLLAHPNMMVRREAQFQLATLGKPSIELLAERARNADHQLARIHAIWALGQIGRTELSALQALLPILADKDAEVCAQTTKVLADDRYAPASKLFIPFLKNEAPRVRFFAAIGLGKFENTEALEPLLDMLRANADSDAYLRHAAVMGLAGSQKVEDLIKHAGDKSVSVRLGIVVALRRLASPLVAQFLKDADPLVVIEAARAIHDVPIAEAMPDLANMLGAVSTVPEPGFHGKDEAERALLLRELNANFRLGKAENAASLASVAQRIDFSTELRTWALEALTDWAAPRGLDRVLNTWRPVEPRDPAPAIAAAKKYVLELVNGPPTDLQMSACQFAEKYKLAEAAEALHHLACDENQSGATRVAAFNGLAAQQYPKMLDVVRAVIGGKESKLRQAALQYLAAANAIDALPILAQTLERAPVAEQQTAIALLAKMKQPDADAVLLKAFDKLETGPAAIQLDLLEAAQASPNGELKKRFEQYKAKLPAGDEQAPFKICLTGGDAAAGKKLFFENEKVQCSRCHKIGGKGGEVGPDLSKVAATRDRNYFLESLILPSAQIAPGFEVNVAILKDGRVVIGNVKTDDETRLVLLAADGKLTEVKKDEIKTRRRQKESAMPPMGEVLTKTEIRNAIEFLTTLK